MPKPAHKAEPVGNHKEYHMPNDPNVPSVPSQSAGWLSDAPGGDIDLDSLFPNPEVASQAQPVAPVQTPQAQAPAPAEWFLDTPTGTKYRTREEAVQGYAKKDEYIAKLESEVAQLKSPKQSAPQERGNYIEHPEEFFDDAVEAASKGDKAKYVKALDAFIEQRTNQRLAPYAPLLSEVARERAIRQAEAETPGVRAFASSPDLQAYVETRPMLKQALEFAQSNPQAADQVKELLQIAYEASLGRKAPELMRTAVQQTAQAVPQPIRPTLQNSSPTLVPGQQRPANPDLYSSEGRKAIIEAGDQRGIGNMDWGRTGL